MRGIGKKILCGMTCAVMAFVSLGSVNLVHAEESADTTGPVIDYDSLEVAEGGTTINVGERVHIKVKVTDNQSGVKEVKMRYWPKRFEWLAGCESIGVDLSYNAQTGYWEGETNPISSNTYMDCQHFFRQIFLGYFSDIVQAFDTLRTNVCGDDYTSLHNPIVLSSVLPAYGMFHSIQILFL